MFSTTDNTSMWKGIKLSKVLQRELKGKVISKVAEEVGMRTQLLHDWHSSSRVPSARNMVILRKLADYLGLTLEEILFDESTERESICTTTFSDRGVTYRINIEKIKK